MIRRLLKRPLSPIRQRLRNTAAYRWLGRLLSLRYTISEATEDERRAVLRWLNPEREDFYQPARPESTDYVAKIGDEIIGFGQLVRFNEAQGAHHGHWLFSLRVKHNWRGRGVGAALMQRRIDQARAEGADAVWLLVQVKNAPARRLHHKLGFRDVSVPAIDAEQAKLPAERRSLVMRKSLR